MAKEKLGGLIVSGDKLSLFYLICNLCFTLMHLGLLESNQGLAARLCIEELNEVLSNATRKRPFHLPDLTKKQGA